MSKTGQWRQALQEMPEYQEGWDAYEAGTPKRTDLVGDAKTAYDTGYMDADYDRQNFD